MPITITGLAALYGIFQNAINNNQQWIDPTNNPLRRPIIFAVLQYTYNLTEFNVKGDTTNEAMTIFCNLYTQNPPAPNTPNNLYDPLILVLQGNRLRIPGATRADGLYIYKRP